MNKLKMLVAMILSVVLTAGCNSIKPNAMQEHLTIKKAHSDSKTPVVFFFQGSGGSNHQASDWSQWFAQHGVSSVMIDSAGVRGIKRLFGKNYGGDLAPALAAASKDPDLDLSRYAVMGFSRGGTAALESASSLEPGQPEADFIFALYPGDQGRCPNSHNGRTAVHVFYGELDNWGTYQGNRNACQRMASNNDNATFHLLANAHHGYDGSWNGEWKCCNGETFSNKSNAVAKANTEQIILEALRARWRLPE